MKLRVITPTLGTSRWLAETIASVAACTHGAEHVLVAPAAKTAELLARFPHVHVVAESGSGMYAAINAGLEAAGAWDAFTYLNDDDLLLPGFARVLTTAKSRDPATKLLVYGGVRLVNGSGMRVGSIPISSAPQLNRALYALRLEPVYQHGAVFTRDAVEALGGFDPSFRLCGDSEFLARACVSGIEARCATRREVAAFRLHGGQLTKNRAAMAAERARVDAKLNLLSPAGLSAAALRRARWRFRLANLPVYAERIARHGFISFDEMLARVG